MGGIIHLYCAAIWTVKLNYIMIPRRIQTTLLTSPRTVVPQSAEKPDLTDVLAAKYGGIDEESADHPPESAFKPHKVYQSLYQDAGQEVEQVVRKHQKRAHREKYMIPLSNREQIKRLKKVGERIFREKQQAQKPKTKVKD